MTALSPEPTPRRSRGAVVVVVLILAIAAASAAWGITARERALILAEKRSILENTPVKPADPAFAGSGIYLGLAASAVIAAGRDAGAGKECE